MAGNSIATKFSEENAFNGATDATSLANIAFEERAPTSKVVFDRWWVRVSDMPNSF